MSANAFNHFSSRPLPDDEADRLAGAARDGDNDSIEKILNRYPGAADAFDIRVYVQQTPLMHAAGSSHIETMKLLIARGADVNADNPHGWTPLHVAARHGSTEAVRFLIENGADVNPPSGRKWPPLMEAVWHHRAETVKLLISAGADIHAEDGQGKTALTHARELEAHYAKDRSIETKFRTEALRQTGEIIKLLEQALVPEKSAAHRPPRRFRL